MSPAHDRRRMIIGSLAFTLCGGLLVAPGSVAGAREQEAASRRGQPAPAALQQLIATVPVGQRPVGIGVNPKTGKVYVTNNSSHTVSVIDGASNTVRATVRVGVAPFYWVGVMPVGNRVFFAHNGAGTLGVIDGATDALVRTIPGLDGAPEGVGVHEGRGRVYVTRAATTLSVVDPGGGQVLADLDTGSFNHSAVVNPVLDRIYVSKTDPDELVVFDLATHRRVATVPATGHPAIDPNTQIVWLTDFRAPRLWLVDGLTNTVLGQVPLSAQPLLAAVDPVLGCLYATYPSAGQVGVVDLAARREIRTVAVGRTPGGIGVDPGTGRVYVANEADDTVSVIQGERCGAAPPPTSTAAPQCVCRIVQQRVPRAVIADALANPASFYGWRYPLDPGKPPSPANPPRECLTLLNPDVDYHPTWNRPVWRVGCR